jgi:hypothetical protein
MPEAKHLRGRFSQVETLAGLQEIAEENLRAHQTSDTLEAAAALASV